MSKKASFKVSDTQAQEPRLYSRRTALMAIGGTIGLAWSSRLWAREFPHRAKVAKIEELTHDVRRITFEPPSSDFDFSAGQYIYLKASDSYITDFNSRHKTDHGETSRPYSFASSPSESTFSLIIKHYGPPRKKPDAPPGVVSTYVHKHLKVGDSVELSEPRGSLYLKDDSKRPIVLLAGGVGCSPFVGLINYFFENKINEERKIYFFMGVRAKRDLILHDQFLEWSRSKKNFYYIPALSHPADGDVWKGEKGYINAVFERYFTENIDADAYIAGSPTMRKFATQSLESKGVASERIRFDRIKVGED